MLADIGRTLHASPHQVGWIATATQVGYALGMPLFIPLGDYVDRRRYIHYAIQALRRNLTEAAPEAVQRTSVE